MMEVIKTHYTLRKVSNMFYVQIVDYISNSSNLRMLSKADISELIEELLIVCPGWISKVIVDDTPVLRIDKNQHTADIFEQIRNHYQE